MSTAVVVKYAIDLVAVLLLALGIKFIMIFLVTPGTLYHLNLLLLGSLAACIQVLILE